MTDIRKLMGEIAKPNYKTLKPDEIVTALNAQVPIPPPPPPPTTQTLASLQGIGTVSLVDVLKAQKIAAAESVAVVATTEVPA